MAISHKPGTVFNSPETQQWAIHGQPTCPTSVSPFGTEFLTHFLSYKHPSIIYSINYHINTPIQSPTATDCPRMSKKSPQFSPMFWDRSTPHSRHFLISSMHFKCQISRIKDPNSPQIFWAVTATRENLKKIPTIRSHVLGPIKRPLTASNQPKHGKTLKNGNKTQVGRKSYFLELSKTHKPGVHA